LRGYNVFSYATDINRKKGIQLIEIQNHTIMNARSISMENVIQNIKGKVLYVD